MAITPEDAAHDEMVAKIIEEHKGDIRDEIRDELEDEIRDELIWDEEFIAEALELHGEDHVVWVKVTDDKIQTQISQIATVLKHLLSTMTGDNQLPGQKSLMHEIERRQLIAVLEVALVELKAPYLDRGRFRGIKTWLARIARKAVDQQATQAVQDALSDAANKTTEFVTTLDASDRVSFF